MVLCFVRRVCIRNWRGCWSWFQNFQILISFFIINGWRYRVIVFRFDLLNLLVSILVLEIGKPIVLISTPMSFIKLLQERALFILFFIIILMLQIYREIGWLNQTYVHLALVQHRYITLSLHFRSIEHLCAFILWFGLAYDHIVVFACSMETSLNTPFYHVPRRVNNWVKHLLWHSYFLLDRSVQFMVVLLHNR
jgi:hypothetical protein